MKLPYFSTLLVSFLFAIAAKAQDSAVLNMAKKTGVKEYKIFGNGAVQSEYRFDSNGNMLLYVGGYVDTNYYDVYKAKFRDTALLGTSELQGFHRLKRFYYNSENELIRKVEVQYSEEENIYYYGKNFQATSTYPNKNSNATDSSYTAFWPNSKLKEENHFIRGKLFNRKVYTIQGNLLRFEDYSGYENHLILNDYDELGNLLQTEEFIDKKLNSRKKYTWKNGKLLQVTRLLTELDEEPTDEHNPKVRLLNKEFIMESNLYNESDSILEHILFTEYGDTLEKYLYSYHDSITEKTYSRYSRNKLFILKKFVLGTWSGVYIEKTFYYDLPSREVVYGTAKSYYDGRLIGNWKYSNEQDSGQQIEKWVYSGDTLLYHAKTPYINYIDDQTFTYKNGLLIESNACTGGGCDKIQRDYDNDKNLITERYYTNGILIKTVLYQYKKGLLSEMETRRYGEIYRREVNVYDSHRNLFKTITYDKDLKVLSEISNLISYY